MDPLTLLLPVIIVVVFYFLIIKPGKQRQRQAMETQNSLLPGAEVRTIAGLYATVTEVEDDSVILEVAPDVHCRFVKSAIAAVLSSGEEPETDEHDDEHDDEADTETGGDAVQLDKKPEAGDDVADTKAADVTKKADAAASEDATESDDAKSVSSDAGDRLRKKEDKQD
ncbi:preprotein translocase subunit YajC [Embleya sp. NBC_00896]|uniref:preprotein translocase subunit YajC n=1 Tax=Embleya sp. NBC_00896 TaxID=2975961 RepID=UPI0038696187|nr:preprotein translocase subunit YajC [Embleya sp. NBC_00896]